MKVDLKQAVTTVRDEVVGLGMFPIWTSLWTAGLVVWIVGPNVTAMVLGAWVFLQMYLGMACMYNRGQAAAYQHALEILKEPDD